MAYHQDWLMRQIEFFITMLVYILTGEKRQPVSIEASVPITRGTNELLAALDALVAQGKICEAENLLYEALESPDRATMEAAAAFYARLNTLSDEELARCNFSRDEILSGLQDVCRRNGIDFTG